MMCSSLLDAVCFFFNDSAPTEIYESGHTLSLHDALPNSYASGKGYANWELSTYRANSSRRALLAAGLPAERIASVVGRADQEHFVPEEPRSPRNRRISIVLLRQAPKVEAPRYKSDN